MINELKDVLKEQNDALKSLLDMLDKQYKMIMSKDVFGLEEVVSEIQLCNKEIAEIEVKRRKLTGTASISNLIKEANSDPLDREFREIQKTIHLVKLQKDTNEVLIRQGLGFTNKLLQVLTPKKEANLYNSYGNIRR